MSFLKVNQIDKVWANICKYEGDVFYTKNHLQYTYIVKDNYVIINIPSKTKITKNYLRRLKGENIEPMYNFDPETQKAEVEREVEN